MAASPSDQELGRGSTSTPAATPGDIEQIDSPRFTDKWCPGNAMLSGEPGTGDLDYAAFSARLPVIGPMSSSQSPPTTPHRVAPLRMECGSTIEKRWS